MTVCRQNTLKNGKYTYLLTVHDTEISVCYWDVVSSFFMVALNGHVFKMRSIYRQLM